MPKKALHLPKFKRSSFNRAVFFFFRSQIIGIYWRILEYESGRDWLNFKMNSERTPRKLNFEVSEYKSQAFGIEPRANQELSLRIEQRANREKAIF